MMPSREPARGWHLLDIPMVFWLPAVASLVAPVAARWKVWVGWVLWATTVVLAVAAFVALTLGLNIVARLMLAFVEGGTGTIDSIGWIEMLLQPPVMLNVVLLLLSAALTVRVGRAVSVEHGSPHASPDARREDAPLQENRRDPA